MDTKHTRGPWKVGEELASDGDFVIKATSGYGIGQAWNLNGNTENAANAKMIAAAPELLEALHVMMKTFELQMTVNGWAMFPSGRWAKTIDAHGGTIALHAGLEAIHNDAYRQAKAAIAKATL